MKAQVCHSSLKGLLVEVVAADVTIELSFGERNFHGHELYEAHLALGELVFVNNVDATIPYHVTDIHADTLTHKGVATLFVDDCALFVHHIVIFKQMLAHSEMVAFYLLLCAFNRLVDDGRLDHLPVFQSEAVHDL